MKKWIFKLKNPALVAAGTLLLAFATALFILPFDLVVGGMSGLAISLHRLIPVKYLTVDRWILFLTWGLFLLGWGLFGKKFAAKTLLSAVLYPPAIALFSRWVTPGGFLDLTAGSHPQIAMLLAALFGGVLIGAGCALTFLGGGSSGGVDVLALGLCCLTLRLRRATALFLVDAATLLLGAAALQDLTLSLLGILSAFTAALAVDYILRKK